MEQPEFETQAGKDCSHLVERCLTFIEKLKDKTEFDESHNLKTNPSLVKNILYDYMKTCRTDTNAVYGCFINDRMTNIVFRAKFSCSHNYQFMPLINKFFGGETFKIEINGEEPENPRHFLSRRYAMIDNILKDEKQYDEEAKENLKKSMNEYLHGLGQCINHIIYNLFGHNNITGPAQNNSLMVDILDFLSQRLSMEIFNLKFPLSSVISEDAVLLQNQFKIYFEEKFGEDYGGGNGNLYEDVKTFKDESIKVLKFGVKTVDLLL
ncbi:hypothetical protein H4219_005834, partial [Mycoemilia scoparia]